MKRGLALILVVLVIAGGVVGFFQYRSSITYSLLQIRQAFVSKDYLLFEHYVDMDSFSKSFSDQLTSSILEEGKATAGDDVWSSLGVAFAAGLVEVLKPTLISSFKEGAKQLVTEGFSTDSLSDTTMTTGRVMAVLNKDRISVNKRGDVALISLKIPQQEYDTSLVIAIKMVKRDQRWVVIEWDNLSEYLKAVNNVTLIVNRNKNAETRKIIENVISYDKTGFYTESEYWSTTLHTGARVSNTGQKAIESFDAKFIIVSKDESDTLNVLDVTSSTLIPPGKNNRVFWDKSLSEYDVQDAKFLEAEGEDGDYIGKMVFTKIVFSGGDSLEILTEN